MTMCTARRALVADGRVKLVDVTEGYIRRGPGIYARVTERIIAADGVCAESVRQRGPDDGEGFKGTDHLNILQCNGML